MNIKEVVKKADSAIFSGTLSKVYAAYLEWKKKDFFNRKKAVCLVEPVPDMFLMQVDHHDNEFLKFSAMDFAVRYLFVEQYYGKNAVGYDLYRKMHTKRGNYGEANLAEEYYEECRKKNKIPMKGGAKEEHSIGQFEDLIRKIEQNGFDTDTTIMADENLLNINGSHRFTMAFYLGVDSIKTDVHRITFKRAYDINWFWENDFSVKEIKLIEDACYRMAEKAREMIGDFYCILFPPAYKYFDDIVNDISEYEPDNIKVKGYEDYEWETHAFTSFLQGVYFFDSILPVNFNRKVSCILGASHIDKDKVKFRVVTLSIPNPRFRLKSDNGMPESVTTVRLKQAIRERYHGKDPIFTAHFGSGYAHDVIIHSSDNSISNRAFKDLLHVDRNIASLFENMSVFDYAIVETTEDKLSTQFPEWFYYNEDLDIIVKERDLDSITEMAFQYCREHFDATIFSVEQFQTKNGARVRVLYNGFMLIMFDFMAHVPGLKDIAVPRLLSENVTDKFKHLSLSNEVLARLAKYLENPNKKWHFDFVKSRSDDLDKTKIQNWFVEPKKALDIIETMK